ncbi:MAG: Jag N-terminal domain-containing protein [Oscillospiraceae bacterium]|nr:Jag N-terminal domain-containing protein [Oscillospiraceae bacterium]
MEKTIVTTGKTIDLAIESALTQLGLTRDDVSVQVLAQAKSGFLGIGATPAKVEVTYESHEAPKSALGAASRSKPKAKKVEAPQEDLFIDAHANVKTDLDAILSGSVEMKKPEAKKTEKKPEPKKAEKKVAPKKVVAPKEFAPAAPGSTEEKIEQFIKGLLEHMNSNAVPHAWLEDGNTYCVELVGDDLGYLIGRRGDTLDAIQHLANYSINRNVEGHIRINVDAEDYREKREDSLRRYAQKKAQQVLKAHRRTTLEPMNAYERHVIHATLQDTDRITTYSVGTEPNRRVVIEYVR